MTSSSEQILTLLARLHVGDQSMKKPKGRNLNYTEPVNSKSNLTWVADGKKKGREKWVS